MKRPVWAVVPAKSPNRGKSRLNPLLGEERRVHFAQKLLEHVIEVLEQCDFDGILVATDGDDVAQFAQAHGAGVLRDSGQGGLAIVVDRALAEVANRGARTALVLMADLPRIRPSDIDDFLKRLEDHEVVLGCDHHRHHTNALAITPPTAIKTSFGNEYSLAAHCATARELGLRLAVVENERIAFDVDGPTDLEALGESPNAHI